jgi:hypothetical protein
MQREPGGASEITKTAASGEPVTGTTHAKVRSSADYVELKYRKPENLVAGKLATGLAFFSLGLGLAEALMPKIMAKAIGVDEEESTTIRLLGLREIGHGLSIFMSQKPTAQLWARVGGDALDLTYLGFKMADDHSNKTRLAIATGAVLGATAMDAMCARMLSSQDWTVDKVNPRAPTNVGQSSARQPLV